MVRDLNINTVIQGPYQSSPATMHKENEFYGASDKFLFSVHWQVLALKQNSNNSLYMKSFFSGNSNMNNYYKLPLREEKNVPIYLISGHHCQQYCKVCKFFGGLCIICCCCFIMCFLNRNRPYRKTYHFSISCGLMTVLTEFWKQDRHFIPNTGCFLMTQSTKTYFQGCDQRDILIHLLQTSPFFCLALSFSNELKGTLKAVLKSLI